MHIATHSIPGGMHLANAVSGRYTRERKNRPFILDVTQIGASCQVLHYCCIRQARQRDLAISHSTRDSQQCESVEVITGCWSTTTFRNRTSAGVEREAVEDDEVFDKGQWETFLLYFEMSEFLLNFFVVFGGGEVGWTMSFYGQCQSSRRRRRRGHDSAAGGRCQKWEHLKPKQKNFVCSTFPTPLLPVYSNIGLRALHGSSHPVV